MTHLRRKLYDLHITNKSMPAEQALRYIAALYEVEREVRDLEPNARLVTVRRSPLNHKIRIHKSVKFGLRYCFSFI